MVSRKSLFIKNVPDWNKKSFSPIVALLLSKELNKFEFGNKRQKMDIESIKEAEKFLSSLMGILRDIMKGRVMPPSKEEIIRYCEIKYNVS